MTTPLRLLAGAGLALSAGCSILGTSSLEMRIENAGSVAIDRIVIYPGGPDSLVATNFAPGSTTDYLGIEKAYRIASVRATVGNTVASIQVIDYVGEEELGGGRYTYRVRFITGQPPQVTSELVKD